MLLLVLLLAQDPGDLRFREGVEVTRVAVEARILDRNGQAMAGLLPGDLKVSVDDTPVEVESLLWVGADAVTGVDAEGQPVAAGRRVVLLFQKDLEPSRTPGLLRVVREAETLLAGLPAADEVAVLSHDTRLRLWLDFTRDRARAVQALRESVVMGRPLAPAAGEAVLASRLHDPSARAAASLDAAVRVVADALEGLPGSATVVLAGGTMGATPGAETDQQLALDLLNRAHIPVFSLDVTDADHHTLETGLQQVAQQSGGFYARTHDFPGAARARLQGALTGHYLVTFPRPDLPRGRHLVRIRLAHGAATVLARPIYTD